MKYRWIVIACSFGVAFSSVESKASAASPSRSYDTIAERNVFSLIAPAPTPAPQPVAPVLPKFTLSGITTVFGDKRVILKMLEPGKGAKEQTFILSEGQATGALKLQEVDVAKGAIKINYSGTELSLALAK